MQKRTSIRPGGQPEQTHADSPFHAGELTMQQLAGVRESAERVGRSIRDFMLDQHRELFTKLPYAVVGSEDALGRPWASLLAAWPGFIEAPDAHTLIVRAPAPHGDDLSERLSPGARVGLLGIELETRRRNRANGRIVAAQPDGFTVHVEQSFGNCPKYITPRVPLAHRQERPSTPRVAPEAELLSAPARALIAQADTFFIASRARREASGDPRQGLDVSHRGGHTGFVTIESEAEHSVLSFLDYRGNMMFNTLGNVLQDPRVGVTFVDFQAGDLLMLTGRASVMFDLNEAQQEAGGERLIRVRIEQGKLLENVVPFAFRAL